MRIESNELRWDAVDYKQTGVETYTVYKNGEVFAEVDNKYRPALGTRVRIDDEPAVYWVRSTWFDESYAPSENAVQGDPILTEEGDLYASSSARALLIGRVKFNHSQSPEDLAAFTPRRTSLSGNERLVYDGWVDKRMATLHMYELC